MTDWNEHQRAIFREVGDELSGSLVVIARAGSGKTSTAIEALDYISPYDRTLMVAFNVDIKKELARRAPDYVRVSTLHGHGFAAVQRAYGGKVQVDERKAQRRLEEAHSNAPRHLRTLAAKVASFAKGLLIGAEDVASIERIFDNRWISFETDEERELATGLVSWLLTDSMEPNGTIDFDDMPWLPVVQQLSCFRNDWVFVDEAQDLNPCQLALVRRSVKRGGRVCALGDDKQCHPPGVKVLVDKQRDEVKVEDLRAGDTILGWNRNAQTALKRKVNAVSVRQYQGWIHNVQVGAVDGVREVPVTPNHKFLCRWADRTLDTYVTYLMWREGFGFRVGWCQMFGKQKNGRYFHLAHRARLENADRVWILKVHKCRTEASLYESIVAARYGIPTMPFEPVHGANHITSDVIRRLFDALGKDNHTRGVQALLEHQRQFELPLYPWPGMTTKTQGRRTYFKVYAANLEPELMAVPLPEGRNTWVPIDDVVTHFYEGPVYSLDVEDHAYAANGVVVLNSIYMFRGADSASLARLEQCFNARKLPLSITYRCPAEVVRHVNDLVPDFRAAPNCPQGLVEPRQWDQMLEQAAPGDFILSRTNAPLIGLCLGFIREGRAATILGRNIGRGLETLIKQIGAESADALAKEARQWCAREIIRVRRSDPEADIAQFQDRRDCIEALCDGASSIDDVLGKVRALFSDGDSRSCIALSSTHKAKGLERPRVWMLVDTYHKLRGGEEANLYYVAATRAQQELLLVHGS